MFPFSMIDIFSRNQRYQSIALTRMSGVERERQTQRPSSSLAEDGKRPTEATVMEK